MAAEHTTKIVLDTFFPGVLWWECQECDSSGGAYADLDEANRDRQKHEAAARPTPPTSTAAGTILVMSRG
jgi:hypothetical protein